MWPRNAGTSLSRMIARGLDCCCMIWSAATGDAGAGCRRCMIDVPVYSVLC